jgi:hypothetical protein
LLIVSFSGSKPSSSDEERLEPFVLSKEHVHMFVEIPPHAAAAGLAITIPGDGHPTALANRMRAAILKNYLEQNMSQVLASSAN